MSKVRKKAFCYEYPHPSVTVDIVLITRERKPRVLLIRRGHDPFAGMWAIPGGFVEMDETLEAAARRELKEETGLKVDELVQLHAFGDPGRDPRGRTIAVAYLARVKAEDLAPKAADDAAEVGWHRLDQLPPLAFDHEEILACARERIRRRR